MKIEISNKERHEIDIPEKVKTDEFLGLMERLDNIRKMVSKDMITEKIIEKTVEQTHKALHKTIAKPATRKGRTTAGDFDTKEKAIKLLQDFYSIDFTHSNSKERRKQKEKFAKDLGFVNYPTFGVSLSKIKKRFGLTNYHGKI